MQGAGVPGARGRLPSPMTPLQNVANDDQSEGFGVSPRTLFMLYLVLGVWWLGFGVQDHTL